MGRASSGKVTFMNLRPFWLCLALAWTAIASRADDATTNSTPSAPAPPTAESLLEKAASDQADGKLEQAINEASAALALDPKNAGALELRGSIYIDEKLWERAERDYTTLNTNSRDPAYQYKLAQIKFLQRQYDDARPLFAEMKDDPRLGDLARYEMLLCDIFGYHETIAAHDLTILDATGQRPSYYYGRGVWCLAHGEPVAANRYAAQASGKFSDAICALYTGAYMNARQLFQPSMATFTTKDGQNFDHARVNVDANGLRALTQKGWVTIPISQLPDDLSPFPDDLREKLTRQRNEAIPAQAETAPLTFTTKSGQTYRQVRWTLDDSGLLILTPVGWKTVAFGDLPEDLSPFPADVAKQIAQMRLAADDSLTLTSTVSFTTSQGKKFNEARAWLEDNGVLVMTAEGPVTVPFTDLPADLSAFPASWQKQIAAGRKPQAGDAASVAIVSFTTQKGTSYREVRAALSKDGVMVATPNSWITVPLTDLPADLSAFPASWRPLIADWLKSSPDDASGTRVVSFDTKRGKHYDQVRASLDDKGLDVLGPDGWVVVTFDQLPADLSPFPTAWRSTISAGQKEVAKPALGQP
jgi:tetratricopeptide (TPR) repeat protein